MSWEFVPEFDAAHRAALESGKSLVYVSPPAGWAILPLLRQLCRTDGSGIQTLVLVPDLSEAVDLSAQIGSLEALRPVHVASGLARTGRLVNAGRVCTLLATPADVMQLLARSIIRLEALSCVVVLWPEAQFLLGAAESIDTVLAECTGVQRLVATADASAVDDFVERHARRAPRVTAANMPEAPIGPARYALVSRQRLRWAVRATLDSLDPTSTLIWDPGPAPETRWSEHAVDPSVRFGADPSSEPVDLALAVELPCAEVLGALLATARKVAVFARPAQLAYLRRLARPLEILRLPHEADRARDRLTSFRAAIRAQLEASDYSHDLLALTPLFDEYDPALVAAALLRARESESAVQPSAPVAVPTWVHLHLNVGRQDRVRTGDVVGALLNAVGLSRDHIGRVDVRESFTVVEVREEAAHRALQGLRGVPLRGRAVAVRFDQR